MDPFGNDGYPNQNIRVDVLVSELNFGAASRWVEAAHRVPSRYSRKNVVDANRDIHNNVHPL